MRILIKIKTKLKQYEYWPVWVFYAPFVPYWIWNAIKSGSFSYFCKANPGIRFGGFLDYSKFEVLEQIPEEFKPKTQFLKTKSEINFEFPFVVKPDWGERGRNVEVIKSSKDWKNYVLTKNLIVQEWVDLPLEFGVFYAKLPNENNGQILSITGKEFLVYTADGKTTLREFVENHPRSVSRIGYLEKKFEENWEFVHPKGTEILLEPIGNHNRGTRFFDASHLISNELTKTIDEIAKGIDGFYYGRFDIKTNSEEELKNGKIIVLEVNGANSEPTHIYDSKFTLTQAYKEVKRHFDIQFQIAIKNPKTYSSIDFYKAVLRRIF